jgi:hypothetical protein
MHSWVFDSFFLLFLVFVCVCGDFLIAWQRIESMIILRILSDACTHILVGCLSWALVMAPVLHRNNAYEIALCSAAS